MLRLRHFSVWVNCNGVPLPVYEPAIDAHESGANCCIARKEEEASITMSLTVWISYPDTYPFLADLQGTLERRGKQR